MPTYDVQFVDSISATPTVRLDLRGPGWTVRDGTTFGMPELKRSTVSTLLVDGDRYPAAAYGNRVLSLLLRIDAATDDATAEALQTLYRELDRPTNILRYRPDTTAPVFFRTFRAGPSDVVWNPVLKEVSVSVPAEPFALGLRETLPAVTVYNDPAEGTELNSNPWFEADNPPLNANPFFETNAAGWTGLGGTVARSTAQAHEGVASLLLTPDGVSSVVETRADSVTATVGTVYRASAWVRCAVSRDVNLHLSWRDSGGGLLSSSTSTVAVTAGTWTLVEASATAPASTAQAQLRVSMFSTPLASHTLHIDEATLRVATPAGWTAAGGTFVRSTAQAHEGAASGLLTPDGSAAATEMYSEMVPVTVGASYRPSAWVRCAAARNVAIYTVWFDSGGGFVSSSSTTTAASANTWTFLDRTAVAPAGAATVRLGVVMDGTPPAGHTLHVDEARLRQAGGAGGMCFDVTSPKGDVEAPLFLSVRASDVGRIPESSVTGRRQSVFAVRRGGTPSAMPAVVQAESMSVVTDTSVQPASGSSGTFLRISFATATSLQQRASIAPFPASPSTDARGTYRVFLRCRKSVSGDTVQVQMEYISSSASVLSDLVTVPAGTVWRWVDMGLVQLPLGYDPVVDGLSGVPLPAAGLGVYVSAARAAGSGNLDIDAIMFAPADDRLCLVKWPDYNTETAYVVDPVAGQAYGVGASGEVRSALLELTSGGPLVTPGVANRIWMIRDVGSTWSAGDDVTASVQVTPYYWPCYLHVRPVAS